MIASGLREPAGVAFRDGALYVSAISRILRFDDIERRLADPPQPVVVSDRFPTDGHHGRKFIAFGPDGKLYVPVGAPCNVCEPDPDRYGDHHADESPTAAGSKSSRAGCATPSASTGIRGRRSCGSPTTAATCWATTSPPDTLNHAPRAGLRFGFPYCHGGHAARSRVRAERPCSAFRPPAQNLGPHVASLGMRFYTGTQFPAAYRNRIFIAEHGSWNRSRKIGYRVTMVTLDGDKAVRYEPFAEGWLQGESAWGRPADVLVAPDGSLLVSDDYAGAIYRIRYRGQ